MSARRAWTGPKGTAGTNLHGGQFLGILHPLNCLRLMVRFTIPDPESILSLFMVNVALRNRSDLPSVVH